MCQYYVWGSVYSQCVFYPFSSLYSSNIWQEAYGGCRPLNTFKLAWRAATVVSCCRTDIIGLIQHFVKCSYSGWGSDEKIDTNVVKQRETAHMAVLKVRVGVSIVNLLTADSIIIFSFRSGSGTAILERFFTISPSSIPSRQRAAHIKTI